MAESPSPHHLGHHLAQLNVGRILAPIDSPQLADFVAGLDPVNALAEATPGFVWRLQTEDGDATAIRPFDDEMVLVNMSVWESLDALADFVYRSDHVQVMRRRREWFEPTSDAFLVLWWIPGGSIPSIADAQVRLEHLKLHGPSPRAFTFRQHFPPPGEGPTGETPASDVDDRWTCPAS